MEGKKLVDNLLHKARNLLVSLGLILVLFSGLPARGAEFFFGTHTRTVAEGDRFEVGVLLNTVREEVNAVSGTVVFSDALEVEDIRIGSSVVTFWVASPEIVSGRINFSGAIPGGFIGADGYLFSVFFRARRAGEVTVSTEGEQVLLNDGAGTSIAVERAPLAIAIGPVRSTGSEAPAGSIEPPDFTPPAPFSIAIAQDKNLFDGQWFAAFLAQDRDFGIDYYEVNEHDGSAPPVDGWLRAASPYRLSNQKLNQYISVRAVDRAGNVRVSTRAPEAIRETSPTAYLIGLGVVIVVGLVGVLAVRRVGTSS